MSTIRVRVKIGVLGFTEHEAEDGLPLLLEEFKHHPWLLTPEAKWDELNKQIEIMLEIEDMPPEIAREFAFDEVWDCVIATINFSSEGIKFDILEVKSLL